MSESIKKAEEILKRLEDTNPRNEILISKLRAYIDADKNVRRVWKELMGAISKEEQLSAELRDE